jgi:drug/metabolite transporter (DMT)-like permease
MNTAISYCLVAMAFYALEIAITDWQLSGLPPRLVTFLYAIGVATCAGVRLLFEDRLVAPTGRQWIFVGLMVAASFLAATAHFEAIHRQAGAVVLTLAYCLMPVAASIYMALFAGRLPTLRTAIAWVIAALALYVLATAPER